MTPTCQLPQILIISQVCLGEQGPSIQLVWGGRQSRLGGIHFSLWGSSLCQAACAGDDRHRVAAMMDAVGVSSFVFWLKPYFDSKEMPPATIFQCPGRLFNLFFFRMHFVNHSGDGKFMYLDGKFMLLCWFQGNAIVCIDFGLSTFKQNEYFLFFYFFFEKCEVACLSP